MLNGGFPQIVSNLAKNNKLDDDTLEIYKTVIFSEFEKQKRSLPILKSILRKLYTSITTPLSYNNILLDSDSYSVKGVIDYLDILHYSFLSFQIGCLDMNKKIIFPKKEKKIYFIDGVILQVISNMFNIPMIDESKLAEQVVAYKLIRKFKNEWASYGFVDKLFYWKSKKQNEVDFVFYKDSKPFGIEVKYQNIVSGWDLMGIKKGIGKGILITKNVFRYSDIPAIPLWAFLYCDV